MQIAELDEYQGVTYGLVREWLVAHGWTQRRTKWWELGGLGFMLDTEIANDQFWLYTLAAIRGDGIQALLREINPRLRSWPSREARAAHDGLWLVVVSEDETGAIGRFRNDVPWFSFNADANGKGGHILTEEESFAMYWPCDEHGNKVRWPVDAKGSML